MTAKQFIIENLTKLAQQFPDVQIKYAYNFTIETHVIEFTPEEAYYNNEALDNAWIPFSVDFDTLFLDESIAFISSDSSLCIQQAENTWNEKNENLNTLLLQQYSVKVDFALSNILSQVVFPSGSIHSEMIFNSPTSVTDIHISNKLAINEYLIGIQNNPNVPTPGNTQYAMAA